jgi:magnesium-transporting ATPase (P-type)
MQEPIPDQTRPWHALPPEQVLQSLHSSDAGLGTAEARERLQRHGPNRLAEAQPTPAWKRFLRQFHNVLIYVLIAAGVVTAALSIPDPSHWIDTAVIFAVVLINAWIGYVQEGKAERALEAIRGMLSTETTVIREGQRSVIDASDLVPGDVISVRSGDKVPADARLLSARELRVEESALTGESVPVEKSPEPVEASAALGDRRPMIYSSTLVSSGAATAVVVGTGDQTQIGQISTLVARTESMATPLIRQMHQFGRILAIVVVIFAAVTFLFGHFVRGENAVDMFLAAVALAVAAIPEGLPAIMTIVLAIGVRRMAGRNAIIRRLAAVDTLGAVTVICSDKTGTLTANEMTVTRIALPGDGTDVAVEGVGYQPAGRLRRDDAGEVMHASDPRLARLLEAGVLCNEAQVRKVEGQWRPEGDPMEAALLTVARKAGLDTEPLRQRRPALDAIPFESAHRYMATLHDDGDARVLFVKGAPERVLEMCDGLDRDPWQDRARAFAEQGLRVLAAAQRRVGPDVAQVGPDDVQHGLEFLGLWGIVDPPRDAAITSVRQCHEAGIRVKMITGDHAVTARAIGRQLAIGDGERVLTGNELDALDAPAFARAAADVDVFARVSPEHKLRLVEALQAGGEVTAMTGDGVNDAPALKRADVGVAMGVKGTEVTKEAADMVLADDNFASITHAVEEGRTVYDNLRKAILFTLPTNGGEGLTILAAILAGRTLPLTPVQVLWVNTVTAVTLALALAFEPPEADTMRRPPRPPAAPLVGGYFLWRILFVSLLLMAGTFGLFLWMRAHDAPLDVARTAAVNVLVIFEIFYLLNCRYLVRPVLSPRDWIANRYVLLAIAAVLVFQMLFTYLPLLQWLFGTAPLDAGTWAIIVVCGVGLFGIVELEKALARRRWADAPL